MKKMNKIFMILAAVAMISCVEDNLEKNNGTDDKTVVASFEASRENYAEPQSSESPSPAPQSVASKTILVNGLSVNWVADDAVAVFDGTKTCSFTAKQGGASSEFVTSDESFNAVSPSYTFAYPATAEVSASAVNFTLASEQQAVLNSFDPAYGLAVAKAAGLSENVVFKNPLSLLKFTVPASLAGKITKISVKGNAETDVLGGKIACDYSGDAPAVTLASDGQSQMSLVSANGMAAGDYYLAVLPGTVTGLTLTVTAGGKEYPRLTHADNAKTFNAGTIYNMGTVSISEGTLLDVVFRADATAYDRSAYGRSVNVMSSGSVTMNDFGDYVTNLNKGCVLAGWSTNSFYRYDYSSDTDFQNGLNDGYALEVLFKLSVEATSAYKSYETRILSTNGKTADSKYAGTYIKLEKKDQVNQYCISFVTCVNEASNWADAKTNILPEKEKYYHVIGVFDRVSQKAYTYVNGVQSAEVDAVGEYVQSPKKIFDLGGNWSRDDQVSNAFVGDVAIARIWDDPLSAEKVTELYNAVKHMVETVASAE